MPLCEWQRHVRAANPGAPFLAISYQITFLLSIRQQMKEQGLESSMNTLCKDTNAPSSHIFWVWQGLNLVSCLECVCANCQCALGEFVDIA